MPAPKKLFVKTYGCQMNVYDSERMTAALAAEGYVATGTAEDADLILLNTCHIREKAAEKVYSELGRLRPLKARNPGLRIGVTGCVAQAEGAEIVARAPVVDLVVGPQAYHRLPRLLARREAGERPVETEFPEEDKFDHLAPDRRARRAPAAFLTVQEGCDKFCAFCVVPYTRGAEVSRPGCAGRGGGAGDGGARRGRADVARAERQRLSRSGRGRAGGADRAAGADRGARADPLHHLASERHGRGADRGAWRGAEADALPAPAGAGGERSDAEGDEPAASGGGLSAAGRADQGGAAGYRAVGGLHRRVSGGDGGGLRRDLGAGRGGGVRAGLLLRLLGAAGDAGGGAGRGWTRPRRRSGCSGCRRC